VAASPDEDFLFRLEVDEVVVEAFAGAKLGVGEGSFKAVKARRRLLAIGLF
jgi:hypothetical protein